MVMLSLKDAFFECFVLKEVHNNSMMLTPQFQNKTVVYYAT